MPLVPPVYYVRVPQVMGTSRVPLATVAALTLERDTEIRKSALNTLSTAYRILGEPCGRQTEAPPDVCCLTDFCVIGCRFGS